MLEIIVALFFIGLDQASKSICASWLPTLPQSTYPLIDGVFSLTYVENRGAAFGMLQNARWLFLIITIAMCAVMIFFLVKEHHRLHTLMRFALALVIAGAVGNFIDRAALGYVRDMLYFALIDFPVFNVADSAVCVGAGLLLLDLLFFKGKTLFSEMEAEGKARKEKKPRLKRPTRRTGLDPGGALAN